MRIVFSWKASQSSNNSSPCIQCGADTVLSSPEELERAFKAFFSSAVSSDDKMVPREASLDAVGSPPAVISSDLLCLANRTAREDMLQQLAEGRITHRIQQSRYWTERIQRQRTLLSSSALISRPFNTPTSTTIRVVHVSDTHNQHGRLSRSLPQGDLFLHTGDIVGNYDHKIDILAQLVDFL
jgi:hypothetical protein